MPELNVNITKFDDRKIKGVMSKVLEEKINNLVKLHFDFYYAKKAFSRFGGDKRVLEIPNLVVNLNKENEELFNKVQQEKRMKNHKDKTVVIELEQKIEDNKDEIEQLKNELSDMKELKKDIDKSRVYVIQSELLIKTLRDEVLKRPQVIYEEN